ncbi:MAG: hypothetical protein AAGA80_13765 [Cyanobacteria bacterium P01_F01_bin.143]
MTRSHLYAWSVCLVAQSKYGTRIKWEADQQLCNRDQELCQNSKGIMT